jgi:hypothetical protein
MASAETQTVLGDLKNRCSWRMAEGFSKKNSVREADWAVMALEDTFSKRMRGRSQYSGKHLERIENITPPAIGRQRTSHGH